MLLKLSILLTTLTMLGCTQIEPMPEKKDKIYNAINYEIGEISGNKKRTETEVRRAYKALKKVSPHDVDYKFTQQEIAMKKRQIAKYHQEIRYLELKREKRVAHVRKMSLAAFKRGEKWSGADEYEHYKTGREMKKAPRDWKSRVPTMYDPISELADDERAKKAKEEKEREAQIDAMSM